MVGGVDGILKHWQRRVRFAKHANFFIRIILIAGGALLAGAMQFWNPAGNGEFLTNQIIGMAGCVSAFIGAIWVVGIDYDSHSELTAATLATERCREAEAATSLIHVAAYRLNSSYQVGRAVSQTVQQMLSGFGTEDDLAKSLLDIAGRDLQIAAGLVQPAVWSIVIYKAVDLESNARLCPIASLRPLKGQLGAAREWPTGEGFPGALLQKRHALSVGDLQSPDAAAFFAIKNEGLRRQNDKSRYRSVVGYPVWLGTDNLYGFVVATSDEVGHFQRESVVSNFPNPIKDFADLLSLVLQLRLRLGQDGRSDDDIAAV